MEKDMYFDEKYQFTNKWQNVENFCGSEVKVINPQPESSYKNGMNIFIAPCPLYAPGDLQSSMLLPVQTGKICTIDDAYSLVAHSRVGKKHVAYENVLNSVASNFATVPISLTVAFSDRGVLLAGEQDAAAEVSLEEHAKAYRLIFEKYCRDRGINLTYTSFGEQNIDLPIFMNTKKKVDALPAYTVEQIKKFSPKELNEVARCFISVLSAKRHNSMGEYIVNNNDTRKVVKELLSALDINTAYYSAKGYAFTDPLIVRLVGENGIYAQAERMDIFHSMARFTPDVRNMTRLKIKA